MISMKDYKMTTLMTRVRIYESQMESYLYTVESTYKAKD